MKHLALATLFVFSSISQGSENNLTISDSDLRSAEVMDQELADLGFTKENENQETQNLDMEMNGIVIRRGPGPRYPRPVPRPIPRGPIWPRTYPRPIPRPIPVPIPYPRSTLITCYADNEFNQRFSGWAYFASDAQQNALNECYRYSRVCYARGCY